ncbi:OmpA family protein [Aerosakkonema sp. BLCC-F183]|uniref:OmpA family protein n=1 Tax=Aerosakkonema sp. BLCC-F183 TaxID=3342834 RepID=UPI0035B7858C
MKEYSEESPGFGRFLLVLVFRLLLLAVGGGIAGLIGVAIATVNPATRPNKPLVAKLLQLPGDVKNSPTLAKDPAATEASASETEALAVPPPPKLTPQQRQKLEAEVKQLEAQLKVLRDRATTLENQIGNSNASEALETRLQVISQQLKAAAQPQQASNSAVSAAEISQQVSSSGVLISPETLTATLPSDALFLDSQAVLRKEARLILDKLIAELQKYPDARVSIAAHTDSAGEADNNRVLSFRQAQAVEQYLSSTLGDKYHWLVLGYGETRPLVPNNTTINLQRNRRLEITVDSN